jgi:mannan endo-1,4-beta-mannosidase
MLRFLNIDFTSAHIWVENWGYYNSDNPSLENYQKAETFMLNFLQNVSDWSTQVLKKPLLVGEYGIVTLFIYFIYLFFFLRKKVIVIQFSVLSQLGMARDAWSDASKYSPLATVINRTKYFTSLANKVFELEKQNACTGHMFWAFSGIARPSDNTPTWIGDPPHERKLFKNFPILKIQTEIFCFFLAPGWYSIYDSDEKTLNVFAEHAKHVAELK